MKQKKSQMEIIGLAIVIILITLALTFVVRFVILKEPAEFKKSFTQTELASNTLNTFIDTTSRNCKGLSMTELLQDCTQSIELGGAGISCGGTPSCTYVRNAVSEILGGTLDAQNTKYHFIVYRKQDTSSPEIMLGNACLADRESESFPIPTHSPSNPLIIQLDICN